MKKKDFWKETVFYDQSPTFCQPAFPQLGQEVELCLRLHNQSPIKKIILRQTSGPVKSHLILRQKKSKRNLNYYSVKFKPLNENLSYFFILLDNHDSAWFYTKAGLQSYFPSNEQSFNLLLDHPIPNWLEDRVFYQIFIDRFFDGDKKNNVKTNEYNYMGHSTIAHHWGEKPYPFNKCLGLDFFGGDLAGIRKKIPHLKKLGINALYLTPIFQSPSNHKYDTEDFTKVDQHFGSNKLLADLIKELHDCDIKVVLDAVLNHVGSSHHWFDLDGKGNGQGAYQNINSPYLDYFQFNKHPKDYDCWYGATNLPKLNYHSKKLQKEIFGKKNSLVRRWLRKPYNIDGWRFDAIDVVANYQENSLHKEILKGVSQAALAENSQAWLLGEHLCDYTYLVNEGLLHSAVNFQGFYLPLRNILADNLYYLIEGRRIELSGKNYNFSNFIKELATMRQALNGQYLNSTFNFLSTHDLPRILTVLKDNKKLPAAMAMLFSYPGIPCVYYGDEIGMRGGEDPENRCCMIWQEKEWEMNIFTLYRQLIKLRKKSRPLQIGSFQSLLAEGGKFSFVRETNNSLALVSINLSAKSQPFTIPLWKIGLESGQLKDRLSKENYKIEAGYLKTIIPAFSFKILG